eukprot:Nitzschia sp. Nitz4//scaffold344_size17659//260//1594//NITZ4_008807-RA/size17659-snap-gene-0.30-mRNA-1//1//CDS//3329548600//6897//frame0
MSSDNQDDQEKFLLEKSGLSTLPELSALIKLNLPNCELKELPRKLPTLCPNLSILFCPNNHFQELPEIVGQCPKLQMVSFKDNGMVKIHPDALQPHLRWLILTGNAIEAIPDTIGRCKKLQKLMLSGNHLTELPDTVDQLESLELVRLACNKLVDPPMKLLSLPNLKWVAFSGNPFLHTENHQPPKDFHLPVLDDPKLEDTSWPILGKGASGIIREVPFGDKSVAVKTFLGHLTSDGSPQDERQISVEMASLNDTALIQLLGQTPHGALVMELLQGYKALAGPPSLDTCSRDIYPKDFSLPHSFAWEIAMNLLRVLFELHTVIGICHGDFYGHNILLCMREHKVKLSDFGAAFFYDIGSEYGNLIHTVELRAYEVLVKELSQIATDANQDEWKALVEACEEPGVTFETLVQQFGPQKRSKTA